MIMHLELLDEVIGKILQVIGMDANNRYVIWTITVLELVFIEKVFVWE